MKNRILFLSLAALLLFPLCSSAWAIDFTPTGAILTVTYTEPTKNADAAGTLLDDLAKTNVFFQLDAGAITKGPDIAASSVKGGGSVSTQITVPIGPNQKASVKVWATATDLSGNSSADSVSVTKSVDRLPPLPPS